MKGTIKLLFVALLSSSFLACEKVIDLPINDADIKIVVQAFTSNIEGRSYVKLTKTANVYTTNNFETVSGASVTITDSDGISYEFFEDSTDAGVYILPGYKVGLNKTYDLKIIADGEEITATTRSSFVPAFDFIYAGLKSGLPAELQESVAFLPDDFRLVFYLFTDPVPAGDNYRLISYVNGERENNYYTANDVLASGEQFGGVLFGTNVDSLDTVHVELMTMDKVNYDYYFSLVNNTDTGPFAATPSNPVTNISKNALGFFGAYLMDTVSIISQ